MSALLVRALLALVVGLPLLTMVNLIGYFVTYFTLTIFLGCFAPQWAIEGLALMEFCAAMLYSLIALAMQVADPDGEV